MRCKIGSFLRYTFIDCDTWKGMARSELFYDFENFELIC
jgi:hypothetical protein